jgi:hypothetical protein
MPGSAALQARTSGCLRIVPVRCRARLPNRSALIMQPIGRRKK